MSRLLALDQASITSGWAVFDNEGKLEKYGKIRANSSSDLGERLVYIRNEVLKLIDEFNIDEIAFEDIQLQSNVGNNVQTFKILAEVFGVIYELATERGLPQTTVLSTVWKSTLGIKGRTRSDQKANATKWVMDTYQLKPTQDEVDAICLGAHIIAKKQEANTKTFNWDE